MFIPLGPLGSARALDFAVTSGMRHDREAAVLADPEGAIAAYEELKRGFQPPGAELPTEEACLRAGFRFIPMVMEAHGGGWGAGARGVIGAISRCVAAARNVEPSVASLELAQRISIVSLFPRGPHSSPGEPYSSSLVRIAPPSSIPRGPKAQGP